MRWDFLERQTASPAMELLAPARKPHPRIPGPARTLVPPSAIHEPARAAPPDVDKWGEDAMGFEGGDKFGALKLQSTPSPLRGGIKGGGATRTGLAERYPHPAR